MSGKVFTRVVKPASATPTRSANKPVHKRSPWVQRQAGEAQQENGPSIHGGAVFDFTTIPLFPPSRAGIQDKLRGGEPNDKYGYGAGQQAVTDRHKPGSVLQRQDAGASEKITRKGLLTPAQETAAINYNRKRYKSNSIKIIQAITGTTVDGVFGRLSVEAVAGFQQVQGLGVDGKVGSTTLGAMMGNLVTARMYESAIQLVVDFYGLDIRIREAGLSLRFDANLEVAATSDFEAGAPQVIRVGQTAFASTLNLRNAIQQGLSTPQPAAEEQPQQDPIRAEWDAHPGIHHHFRKGFDTYTDLRPLYQARGIENPAQYLDDNIISVTFFGRRTPANRDVREPLQAAERALRNQDIVPDIGSFWAFNPRRTAGGTLSNHALGHAFDINPGENPHIRNRHDIRRHPCCDRSGPRSAANRRDHESGQPGFSDHLYSRLGESTDPTLAAAPGRTRPDRNGSSGNSAIATTHTIHHHT